MTYYPFGSCRNSTGDLATDKLFTGQRLDGTGLYYYGARFYDPTIGRFISADTIVPNPKNPQSLNRYSYVLNNPLRFTDPTGHQDEGDYYYQQVCAANGIDPNAGVAIFMGDNGQVIGTVQISTLVSWVDTSPAPFDYISREPSSGFLGAINQAVSGAARQAVGIESAVYYHKDLNSAPVTVNIVGENGLVPALMGDTWGVSLFPFDTYVKGSELPGSPWLPAHEAGGHYPEQQTWGPLWYAGYGLEIAARSVYYEDTFWGYYTSSFEQRARDWAGQLSLSPPTRTTGHVPMPQAH